MWSYRVVPPPPAANPHRDASHYQAAAALALEPLAYLRRRCCSESVQEHRTNRAGPRLST